MKALSKIMLILLLIVTQFTTAIPVLAVPQSNLITTTIKLHQYNSAYYGESPAIFNKITIKETGNYEFDFHDVPSVSVAIIVPYEELENTNQPIFLYPYEFTHAHLSEGEYWLIMPYNESVGQNETMRITGDHYVVPMLRFETNGGNLIEPIPTDWNNNNERFEIPQLPEAINEGRVFEGWYTDSLLTNELNLDSYSELGVHQDITLYAKYQAQNSSPIDIQLSNTTVVDGSPIGTVVGTLSTIDADEEDTHSYSLIQGTGDSDNEEFTIINNNQLVTDKPMSIQTVSTKSIRIQTNDGKAIFEKAFMITISEIPKPVLEIDITNHDFGDVNEGTTGIAKQVSVKNSGPTGTTLTGLNLALGHGDDSAFSVNQFRSDESIPSGNSTAISIKVRSDISGGLYSDTLRVTADGGLEQTINLTVNILETHSVIFMTDESVVQRFTILDDELIAPIDPPVRQGYTFTGWYPVVDNVYSDIPYIFDTPVTQDFQLLAKYSINTFDITFEENEGSPVEDFKVEYGKTISLPANPTRPGYTFTGWFTDAEFDYSFEPQIPITQDTTLYAKWLSQNTKLVFQRLEDPQYFTINQQTHTLENVPFDYSLYELYYDVKAEDESVIFSITYYRKGGELVSDFYLDPVSNLDSLFVEDGDYIRIIAEDRDYIQDYVIEIEEAAIDDSYSTLFETSLMIDAEEGVLANDELPEGRFFMPFSVDSDYMHHQVVLVSGPSNGALEFQEDGSFIYTPNKGFDGDDTFTYRIIQNQSVIYGRGMETQDVPSYASSNLATVTISVAEEELYDVKFHTGNSETEFVLTGNSSNAIDRPEDPVRQGYTFSGWYTEAALSTEVSFPYSASADTTLYARWLDTNANLTLKYENVEEPFLFHPQMKTIEATFFNLTGAQLYTYLEPEAERFTEVQYWRDGELVGCLQEWIDIRPTSEEITPFGKSCNVMELENFVIQDGDIIRVLAEDPSFTEDYRIEVLEAAIDDTEDDGYSTKFNTTLVTEADQSVLQNDQFFRQYRIADISYFTTSLDVFLAEGGDVSHGELTLNTDGTFTYNPEDTFEGQDTFSYYIEYRVDEMYGRYNTTMFLPETNVARSNIAQVTITVEEEPHYTMTFEPNNDEERFTEQESTDPETDQLILVPEQNPTRDGYTFAGWFYDDNTFQNQVTFPVNITEDVTVYAKWELNSYVITFDENEGSTVADPTVDHFEKVSAPADPTREGYTFGGWFNGDTEYDFDSQVTGPLTLTAKWTINTYTFTFDSNGGSEVAPENVKHFATIEEPIPTRNGYTFVGWNSGEGRYDFTKETNMSLNFTAMWESQDVSLVAFGDDSAISYDGETQTLTVPFEYSVYQFLMDVRPNDQNVSRVKYVNAGEEVLNIDSPDYRYQYHLQSLFVKEGDQFILIAEDGIATDTYTVTIPEATEDDMYSTNFRVDLEVSAQNGVLANDTLYDIPQPEITIMAPAPSATYTRAVELVSDVTNGVLELNADGSFTYMPYLSFSGTDTFEYRISYTTEEMMYGRVAEPMTISTYSDLATVEITVGPRPAPPTPPSDGEIIVVDEDNPDDILIRLLIDRQQMNGVPTDLITMDEERVRQALENLTQDTSRVIIPARPDNPVTQITLPTSSQSLYGTYQNNLSFELPYLELYLQNSQILSLQGDLTLSFNHLLLPTQSLPIVSLMESNLPSGSDYTLLNAPVQVNPSQDLTDVRLGLPVPMGLSVSQYSTLRVFVLHSDGTTEWLDVTVENGMAYFTTPKFSTFMLVSVEEAEAEGDLPYIRGFEDKTFRPGLAVTRHQIAAMFARKLSGNNIPVTQATFTDTRGSWAKNEIEYVRTNGIMNGVSATMFDPTAPMTRAQIAVTADRYLQKVCGLDMASTSYCGNMAMGKGYSDVSDNEWGSASIKRMQALGIITGYNDGTFRASEYVTRAQVVTIINRLFDMAPATSYDMPSFTDVSPSYWAYMNIERATRGK